MEFINFDVNADPDDIRELLTTIRDTDDLYEGDVICIDNTGYYLDYNKIYIVDDFMQSRIEAERHRQEELAKQEQERIADEERRRQQEEEQRRLEEQKKKKEEVTTKQVQHKTRNKLRL